MGTLVAIAYISGLVIGAAIGAFGMRAWMIDAPPVPRAPRLKSGDSDPHWMPPSVDDFDDEETHDG